MAAEQYVTTLFYLSAAKVILLKVSHYHTRLSGDG